MKLRVSRHAQRDLDAIWNYIAHDSVDAAQRVIEEIERAIRLLMMFPQMGHRRDDIPVRDHLAYSARSYLIIYRARRGTLTVLRVVDGRRDLSRVFK